MFYEVSRFYFMKWVQHSRKNFFFVFWLTFLNVLLEFYFLTTTITQCSIFLFFHRKTKIYRFCNIKSQKKNNAKRKITQEQRESGMERVAFLFMLATLMLQDIILLFRLKLIFYEKFFEIYRKNRFFFDPFLT